VKKDSVNEKIKNFFTKLLEEKSNSNKFLNINRSLKHPNPYSFITNKKVN